MKPYTVEECLSRLQRLDCDELKRPAYSVPSHATNDQCVGLAVESMKRHTTDEGWQLFKGLEEAGYCLQGWDLHKGHPQLGDRTDVKEILSWLHPKTVVLQDAREWMGLTAGRGADPRMRFTNVEELARRTDVYKVTVLKDAQNNRDLNVTTSNQAGVHAWVCYYNEKVVKHLAPYVRTWDLIRTYHTVDDGVVPRWWSDDKVSRLRTKGCVISGAISSAYPLRKRLFNHAWMLPNTTVVRHPGYHRGGCCTPEYLSTLVRYRVSICTASMYGYLLRKIIESVVCGCVVITDLPADEVVPEVDECLVRVRPDAPTDYVGMLVRQAINNYDLDRQKHYALKALDRFNYHYECVRLAGEIESHRLRSLQCR